MKVSKSDVVKGVVEWDNRCNGHRSLLQEAKRKVDKDLTATHLSFMSFNQKNASTEEANTSGNASDLYPRKVRFESRPEHDYPGRFLLMFLISRQNPG